MNNLIARALFLAGKKKAMIGATSSVVATALVLSERGSQPHSLFNYDFDSIERKSQIQEFDETEDMDKSEVASICDSQSDKSYIWADWNVDEYLSMSTITIQLPTCPTNIEVDVALEQVQRIPVFKDALSDLSEDQYFDFTRQIMATVQDTDFQREMRRKVEERQRDDSKTVSELPDSPDNDIHARWQQLIDRHRCVFCQDLLSAPMLLKCTHSYCFHCIKEYSDRCCGEGDNAACVVLKCPTCPNEFKFEDAVFERNLHDAIAEVVMEFPYNLREEWEMRCQTYFLYRKGLDEIERRKKDEERIMNLQHEERLEELMRIEKWNELCQKYVPCIAFVVLVIIGLYRSKA